MIRNSVMVMGICMLLNMPTGAIAQESSVDVEYTYDNPQATNDPDYFVSVPVSIEFNTSDIGQDFKINVELKPAIEGDEIPVGAKVNVSVKSKKGFVLSLDDAGKVDPVAYKLVYGTTEIGTSSGTVSKIGTLQKLEDEAMTQLRLDGFSTLTGVAKETGDHSDILTFIIEDISTYRRR